MFAFNRKERCAEVKETGRIIQESAYEGRNAFRRMCAFGAAAVTIAAVLTSAPAAGSARTVSVDLDDVRSPAYLSEYTGEPAVKPDETLTVARVKEVEVVDRAVEALYRMDVDNARSEGSPVIRTLSSYASVMTNEEVNAIFAEREAEAERQRLAEEEAARKAAIRSYSTTYNYVGLNTKGIPMSQKVPSVPIELDANGVPLHYSYCITDIATAYTNDPITSTGTVPVQGTVAVDPRIIPYGTRMYITSADGRYVYGYCVAEDTGGFIYLRNGPAADLFMYSESDCDQWGWRMAKIYILA